MADPSKSFLVRHGWQIILALIALGGAMRGVEMTLLPKADRTDVQALAARVDDLEPVLVRSSTTDSLLRTMNGKLDAVQREFRTLRLLYCRREATDSFCSPAP